MSTDSYKGVNFTAGQEIRAQDLIDAQRFARASLRDALFEKLTIGPSTTTQESQGQYQWTGKHGTDVPSSYWAYTLHGGQAYPRKGSGNDKVQISAGTLFQKIAAHDGNESTFLPYTFEGTEEVTIANGDGSNPRVDIVQMKLELITTDSQARVVSTPGVKASRDLNPLTSNCETVIRARAAGFGGNAISIQFVADGSGAGSLTQSGYQLVFHYQTGVTTVANFETAVQASALIEVQTVDGVGTLTSPGDTFGPVFLTGGTDQVLSSANVNMKRRVQCTLSVKQGTPAASPRYPSPDAGYVTVAAVVVPTAFAWGSSFVFDDHATSPVLHDQRMPMGVPRYDACLAKDVYADPAKYVPSTKGEYLTLGASLTNAYAPCRSMKVGRLLAVNVHGCGVLGTAIARYWGLTNATSMNGSNAEVSATGTANALSLTSDREYMESAHLPGAGPTVLPSTSAPYHGPPMWTCGRRVAVREADATEYDVSLNSRIILLIGGGSSLNGGILHAVNFLVAEGI